MRRRTTTPFDPPVSSVADLVERMTAPGAGEGGGAPPFAAGDAVVVGSALWDAAAETDRARLAALARAHGVTLRTAWVQGAVIERKMRA